MRMLCFFGLLLASFPFASCTSTPDPNSDSLTQAQLQAADAIPSVNFDFNKLILPNGELVTNYLPKAPSHAQAPSLNAASLSLTGLDGSSPLDPQERLKTSIAAMLSQAKTLMDRSKMQFADEGPNKPAQNGLGYSWGSKQFANRTTPPGGGGCTQSIHGLDCSGFVYQCALAAGLSIPTGTASTQSSASTWTQAIPADWHLEGADVADGNYFTGDIISWGNHIGIIAKDSDGNLFIFQSNGSSAEDCADACSDQCQKNIGPNRGPRPFSFKGAISAFGSTFSVIRLRVKSVPSVGCCPSAGNWNEMCEMWFLASPGVWSRPYLCSHVSYGDPVPADCRPATPPDSTCEGTEVANPPPRSY